MRLSEMLVYGFCFVASIAGFLWLLIAVVCAMFGGSQ